MGVAGTLRGIALRSKSRAPMDTVEETGVDAVSGIGGDFRGKSKKRQVTVLALSGWQAALHELGRPDLPWTTRRANLLVEGVTLPQQIGARINIGTVVLEITMESDPCSRMDEQQPGLRLALTPDWRGGVCCRVVQGGSIRIGDEVRC